MSIKIPPELVWSVAALLGGLAKYIKMHLSGKKKFKISDLLLNIFVSGFSGYMFAHAASLIYPEWAQIVGGIGGYMGIEALDFMATFIKRKFNIPDERE